ncbi:MAG TPA: hypothetical protein DDW27_16895 [Bacteroidales bacterium]|nr:hypothetical protein [Bacteroidales bacterium]
MAAESNIYDDKGKDWDKLRHDNLEMAKEWISGYKNSGFSRVILSKCNEMTLDQVALITKLLLNDNIPEEERLPDTFYFVWQKSYIVFSDKIGSKVDDTQKHITHIDSFLDDKYSFDALIHILTLWDPEINNAFHEFVISFRLPEYFKFHKAHLKHTAEIFDYYTWQHKFGKMKSKYEGYKPILYTVLLEIKDLPHKVLIFIYLALNYSSNINFRLREFFDEKFGCKLKELYDNIDSQYLGRKFNIVFEKKYGEYLLKLPVGDLYRIKDYKKMILLAGEDTIIEDLITSIFFWYNYQNYPDNPDYEKIRNVISQWNKRFREEARAILRDKKRKMGS